MRIFKTKTFDRFAKKEKIKDEWLCKAVRRADDGKIDRDLHGGLIIQRIEREGKGISGGYRTVILFKKGDKAFFVYGYPRKKQNRLGDKEIRWYREVIKEIFREKEAGLQKRLNEGRIIEVECNE